MYYLEKSTHVQYTGKDGALYYLIFFQLISKQAEDSASRRDKDRAGLEAEIGDKRDREGALVLTFDKF